MKCPNDNTTLQMTDRNGIEIDYCPECRGIWLDRGELDKLVERAGSYYASTPAASPVPSGSTQPQTRPSHFDDDDGHYREQRQHDSNQHGNSYNNGGHHKKKKEGFLGDLFDF